MNSLTTTILDFLFPPSEASLGLRRISPAQLDLKLPRASLPLYPFITSLFAYKHPLTHELIQSIKNKKDAHAFECAGYALYKKLLEKGISHATLIPIPLSKKRLKERGYNQCELLIEEILKLDTEKRFTGDSSLLVRTKHTSEQKLKNREERLAGTDSIFEIATNSISKDTPLILIDDVATTGSTLKTARDILISSGFTDVRALTVAH